MAPPDQPPPDDLRAMPLPSTRPIIAGPRVLVLIADPATRALNERVALAIGRAFGERLGPHRWLEQDIACEYPVGSWGEVPAVIETAVRERLGEVPLDVVVVSANRRRKRLLVADMDSTIIGQECIDELAEVAGVGPEVAAITERAMRGELDFASSLQARVGLLAGLDVRVMKDILATRISLNPGARRLVATMRAGGAYTALLSGGFTQLVAPIAAKAGFDAHLANRLEIRDGRLTGHLVPPILDAWGKAEMLRRLVPAVGIEPADTLAVGDGANDVQMVACAALGVAYRAKPRLEAVANALIRHGDLTALLYLQGYSADDMRCAEPSPQL